LAQHNIIGKQGEELAVKFLQELGYTTMETNWQKHKFEIDIIAKHNKEIVFVEVKTRTTDFFGEPEEAVTTKKQKHLIEGADFYIQENEIDLEARFDVISIIMKTTPQIKHIKYAFYPEG